MDLWKFGKWLAMVPLLYPWMLAEVLAVHVSQTLTVSSCSTRNVPLVLNAADRVLGSFQIFPTYGYGDKELKFRVLDSTNTSQYSQPIILDLGTVVNGASFLTSLLVGQEITSLYLTMNVAFRAPTAKRKYGLPMKLPNRLSPSPSQMRLLLTDRRRSSLGPWEEEN